jgi:hypothetical protein
MGEESSHASATPARTHHSLNMRQFIKLAVYSLLLINFGLYIVDDWSIARHTLHSGSTLLDLTAAFATSIDELAWFALLFLFELETYLLSDEAFTKFRLALMHGIRIVCYLFLTHTLYSYAVAVSDLEEAASPGEAVTLCDLADTEISFGHNLEYTELTPANCHTLSQEKTLYLIEDGQVVTDASGLVIERELLWIDLLEAITWLFILLCIEVVVRLQDKGITHGAAIRTATWAKLALYGLLWLAAAYWIYRGHYMFAWDEALWILGFMAIGMNIDEWKKEIEEGEPASSSLANS